MTMTAWNSNPWIASLKFPSLGSLGMGRGLLGPQSRLEPAEVSLTTLGVSTDPVWILTLCFIIPEEGYLPLAERKGTPSGRGWLPRSEASRHELKITSLEEENYELKRALKANEHIRTRIKESIHDRLGRGLVFDDDIAAQKGCGRMRIRRNFASREGSEAARNFREAEVRAEHGNGKGPSGYESEIRDRAEWTRKGERDQEGWRAMEDKEDGGARPSPHQIVDFTPAQPVPSRTFHSYIPIKSSI